MRKPLKVNRLPLKNRPWCRDDRGWVRVAPTPGVLPESGTWEGGDHDAPAGEAL